MSVPEGALVSVCVLLRDRDVLHARRVAGQELEKLGARSVKKTRFVTAVSEIGRNAVMHGGGGEARIYSQVHPPCVTVVCRDKGPGIADVDSARQAAWGAGWEVRAACAIRWKLKLQ